MHYFILALAFILFLLYMRSQYKAHPEKRQSYRLILIAVMTTIAVILLLRFGLHYIAVGVGALVAAIPIIRKLFAFLMMVIGIKKTMNGGARAANGAMSMEEAREILGVSDTASKEEIKKAYQQLMQKNHPDKGGSPYIAQKLNQAKERLLGK